MFWREKSMTLRTHDGRPSRIQSRFVLFGMILSAKHSNDGMEFALPDRHPRKAEPAAGID